MPENTGFKKISNFQINKKQNFAIVSINPKVYALEAIYFAAYVFIDKCFITLDGNPEEEILVEIRPKNSTDVTEFVREFNNELLNYTVYMIQSQKNQTINSSIVKRALLTSECDTSEIESNSDEDLDSLDYEDDPLGIAKPWSDENEE